VRKHHNAIQSMTFAKNSGFPDMKSMELLLGYRVVMFGRCSEHRIENRAPQIPAAPPYTGRLHNEWAQARASANIGGA
jgi:hypothetical protein